MYKDYEVLSFSLDLRKCRTTFIEKLEHFDKAPYGFDEDDSEINRKLFKFFNSRTIPRQRKGYKEILKSTHTKNGFHLAFKGHGLSLSNHYWYRKSNEKLKYDHINFFSNKWDDSFGKALLKEDYKALERVNLNVPDIVTSGWGTKGWIYDKNKGPRLYKLGIHDEYPDEVLGEVLASSLAKRLLSEEEVLQYDLEKINNKYASVSSPMIGIDEELVPLSSILSIELYNMYRNIKLDKNLRSEFFNKLKLEGYNSIYTFFIKLMTLKSLCFVNDLHFDNISIIKNMKTGKIKIAPIYDLGGSFGSGETAKKYLANPNKATLLLIYFAYSLLDSSWDYSWYNKDKLEGFEKEIRETLSKSDFYNDDTLDFVIEIYRQQKEALDEMSTKK